jgi:hypothetical protein
LKYAFGEKDESGVFDFFDKLSRRELFTFCGGVFSFYVFPYVFLIIVNIYATLFTSLPE